MSVGAAPRAPREHKQGGGCRTGASRPHQAGAAGAQGGGCSQASPKLVLLVSLWRCPGMAGPASCPCACRQWAGRSCQPGPQGGMCWDVPGMQGSPQAIWSEATPRRARKDHCLRGWGRGRFSPGRSPGLGGQEPMLTPPLSVTTSRWAAPSVRQESISATAQSKSSSPGPPRAPQRSEGASGSSGWPGAWAG